ncbi:hypothetical protein O3P69_004686 [Scylla paramamosain]|uniref:Uncharacterized protein n=1 Tax=Scylla paramamosain TaxID=85552 RepID=A0AAW0UCH8_SCYPA
MCKEIQNLEEVVVMLHLGRKPKDGITNLLTAGQLLSSSLGLCAWLLFAGQGGSDTGIEAYRDIMHEKCDHNSSLI